MSRLGRHLVKYCIWTLALILFSNPATAQNTPSAGYSGTHWQVASKGSQNTRSTLWIYEFRFDKHMRFERGGCLTDEKSRWGNILKCPISLPANVPGEIVQLSFRCEPPGSNTPCGHTVECPGGNACSESHPEHLFATTPANLPTNKPRSLDWWGWTDDGNPATLIFDAYVAR